MGAFLLRKKEMIEQYLSFWIAKIIADITGIVFVAIVFFIVVSIDLIIDEIKKRKNRN